MNRDSEPISLPIKLFAGTVSGVSISLVVCSILYLAWFVPLHRPGHTIPDESEIVEEIKKSGKGADRSPEELERMAERTRAVRQWISRLIYRPLEFMIVSSACVIAAYFASLYALKQDVGDGKSGGPLVAPTFVGSAAGTVVLWILVSALLHYPESFALSGQSGAAHEAVATAAGQPPPDVHASAEHGEGLPKTVESDVEAAPEAHVQAAPAWAAWMASHETFAQLFVYFGGTVVAGIVACMTPRFAVEPLRPATEIAPLPSYPD